MDFSGGREIPCLLDSSAKKILRERLASLLVGHFNTKQLMKSMKEFYGNSSLALKVLKDLPDVKSVLFIVEMQAQCLLNRDEAISRLKAAGLSTSHRILRCSHS